MSKQKILIVDDDNNIAELISLYLTKECYDTKIVNDGEEALHAFEHYNPNLILLDLMLPGIDGYQVCREIRTKSNVPIIMLSAKGEIFDKVLGLELGADDYILKPFDSKELVARVKAVLRRFQPAKTESVVELKCVEYPDLTVNLSNYSVMYNGHPIDMPPKELELLYFLAASPNQVFTREQLLDHIWGYEYIGDTRTVDVHVNVDEILVGALFKPLDNDGNAVGHLLTQEKQCLLAHKLCDKLLLRHIGEGVIVEIVRALVAVGLEHGKQFIAARTVLSRDRDDVVKAAELLQLLLAGFQRGKVIQQVHLVDNGNGRAALLQRLDHRQLGVGELPCRFKQHHRHIDVLQAGGGGLGHAGVQLVAGGVDAGGVHQHILHGALGDDAGNAAAGRLGLFGHNSDLFAHKVVGQAGFAHIGAADQRHKYAGGHFRNRFCHSVVCLSLLSWKNGK